MRINPDELHVSDPSFIEVLYTNSGKKRESPPWHTRPFQYASSRLCICVRLLTTGSDSKEYAEAAMIIETRWADADTGPFRYRRPQPTSHPSGSSEPVLLQSNDF